MKPEQIDKYGKQLKSNIPLLGKKIRREACLKLVELKTAPVIPYLVEALSSPDSEMRSTAQSALKSLLDTSAINSLCEIWATKRSAELGKIIVDCRYVAQNPVDLRVLTALKTNQLEIASENASCLDSLLEAVHDKDKTIVSNADKILNSLRNKKIIDALCERIISGSSGNLIQLALKNDYYPDNPGRRSLFFLFTNQMERYFDFDFEQQYLRAEYDAGDENLRQRIAQIVRSSGNVDLVKVLPVGAQEKRVQEKESTESEANIAIDVYSRNGKWQEIFNTLFYVPAYIAANALDKLETSGWEPADEKSRALLAELYKIRHEMGDVPPKPPEPDVVVGPVIGEWINEGRTSAYMNKTESQLREDFGNIDPTIAIPALSALHKMKKLTNDDLTSARNHENWLIRIASLGLCETSPELMFSSAAVSREGGELWIDRLIPLIFEQTAYNVQASKLKLNHLEMLQKSLAQSDKSGSYTAHWNRMVEALARYKLGGLIVPDESIIEEKIRKASVGIVD
jgi:hypothetical protein